MRVAYSVVLIVVLALSGCASTQSGKIYQQREAMSAQKVLLAEVVSIQPVTIEGSSTAGSVTGGAVGAAGGSHVGGDPTTHLIGTIIGTVAGAIAGGGVESAATGSEGIQVTVRLVAKEKLVAITQRDDIDVVEGDRVQVVVGDRRVRVMPL